MSAGYQIRLQAVLLDIGLETVIETTSLLFPSGKTSVLLGKSGCGKSLLLKIAAGLRVPSFGSVLYDGIDLLKVSERDWQKLQASTGFAFQDAALWSNLSVYQNLAMPLANNRSELTAPQIEALVSKTLAEVGYFSSPLRRPAEISQGERKLVSIARALLFGQRTLFLDEPYDGLDEASLERVSGLIQQVKAGSTTLVVATTRTSLALEIADYVYIFDRGRLILGGQPGDLTDAWPLQILPLRREHKERLATLAAQTGEAQP